ncbi:MAG: TrbG/VirB9 family P-type conjugative transfer protein [Rickettsiales bacterium]|jgi:type IV secretory pathway VirB9-like protein|nr:TrbG/VirB9 family P-type conjugative transfer protein [Rickettsiales bacterium]
MKINCDFLKKTIMSGRMLFLLSAICCAVSAALPLYAEGVQEAWDNPNANMASGSTKPGYAQLTWTPGTTIPIKLRNGMVTMVNFPAGEQIESGIVGNDQLFKIEKSGENAMLITPVPANMGSDTNFIVTGKSGNKYLFYLRSEPNHSSEITYSQVDIVADGYSGFSGNPTVGADGEMSNVFAKKKTGGGIVGADGEDYGWIKTMKIDPSEFRFDLDIFVPNPDDYVIAPERVWRDRIFTYIDFGDKVIAMTQRPVVSLLIEGGESPVGFRTDGENGRLLIVEAVGDMVLRSGQRIVCIKKRAKPFLISDTQSVMALAESNVMQQQVQSLNYGYNGQVVPMVAANGYGVAPTYNYGAATSYGSGTSGINLLAADRNTAGAYLPQKDIPLISSNQTGVAVELKSDTSVKALNDYWNKLLAKFSGDNGAGLLTPYRDMVFFAVDEQGIGNLGDTGTTARLYRLRLGPMTDIETAQTLCDKLTKFSGTSCHVVRIQ